MLKINKLKKIKSNFPVIVGEQIISKKVCNSLIKEITNSKSFDDMIMGGRSRINKGSKNFNKYISSSKISKKLFATFNTKSFYKKIDKKFKTEFDEEKLTVEFRNLKFDGSEYFDRVFEVASKIVVQSKDRQLAKKIVEAALGRYGITSDGQHPPSLNKSKAFFSMQRTFVNARIKDLNHDDKQQRIDAAELIDFELKLTRLMFLFVSAETWFDGSFLMKVLSPFGGIHPNKKEIRFSNCLKIINYLISIYYYNQRKKYIFHYL